MDRKFFNLDTQRTIKNISKPISPRCPYMTRKSPHFLNLLGPNKNSSASVTNLRDPVVLNYLKRTKHLRKTKDETITALTTTLAKAEKVLRAKTNERLVPEVEKRFQSRPIRCPKPKRKPCECSKIIPISFVELNRRKMFYESRGIRVTATDLLNSMEYTGHKSSTNEHDQRHEGSAVEGVDRRVRKRLFNGAMRTNSVKKWMRSGEQETGDRKKRCKVKNNYEPCRTDSALNSVAYENKRDDVRQQELRAGRCRSLNRHEQRDCGVYSRPISQDVPTACESKTIDAEAADNCTAAKRQSSNEVVDSPRQPDYDGYSCPASQRPALPYKGKVIEAEAADNFTEAKLQTANEASDSSLSCDSAPDGWHAEIPAEGRDSEIIACTRQSAGKDFLQPQWYRPDSRSRGDKKKRNFHGSLNRSDNSSFYLNRDDHRGEQRSRSVESAAGRQTQRNAGTQEISDNKPCCSWQSRRSIDESTPHNTNSTQPPAYSVNERAFPNLTGALLATNMYGMSDRIPNSDTNRGRMRTTSMPNDPVEPAALLPSLPQQRYHRSGTPNTADFERFRSSTYTPQSLKNSAQSNTDTESQKYVDPVGSSSAMEYAECMPRYAIGGSLLKEFSNHSNFAQPVHCSHQEWPNTYYKERLMSPHTGKLFEIENSQNSELLWRKSPMQAPIHTRPSRRAAGASGNHVRSISLARRRNGTYPPLRTIYEHPETLEDSTATESSAHNFIEIQSSDTLTDVWHKSEELGTLIKKREIPCDPRALLCAPLRSDSTTGVSSMEDYNSPLQRRGQEREARKDPLIRTKIQREEETAFRLLQLREFQRLVNANFERTRRYANPFKWKPHNVREIQARKHACPINSRKCCKFLQQELFAHFMREHLREPGIEMREIYERDRLLLVFNPKAFAYDQNACISLLAYGGIRTRPELKPLYKYMPMLNDKLPPLFNMLNGHLPLIVLICRTTRATVEGKKKVHFVDDMYHSTDNELSEHRDADVLVLWVVSLELALPLYAMMTVFSKSMMAIRSTIIEVRSFTKCQNAVEFMRKDKNHLYLDDSNLTLLSNFGEEPLYLELMMREYGTN